MEKTLATRGASLHPLAPLAHFEHIERRSKLAQTSRPPRVTPMIKTHATTILTVRRGKTVAMGGDGQVTVGTTIMKADAMKIRRLMDNKVITGFAGASADAFALLERFEAKLKEFPGNVPRAATELAKQWRTDRVLRRLESLLAVADADSSLIIGGTGDVIESSDGILAIGSGGPCALSAARALLTHTPMPADQIVDAALRIAGEINVYTNQNLTIEKL